MRIVSQQAIAALSQTGPEAAGRAQARAAPTCPNLSSLPQRLLDIGVRREGLGEIQYPENGLKYVIDNSSQYRFILMPTASQALWEVRF